LGRLTPRLACVLFGQANLKSVLLSISRIAVSKAFWRTFAQVGRRFPQQCFDPDVDRFQAESLSKGRPAKCLASLCFWPKNMAQHIFSSKANSKIFPKLFPKPRSFSVSEKLVRYGSSALSGVEHLTLLVGKGPLHLL
jgi:hypothetical protein